MQQQKPKNRTDRGQINSHVRAYARSHGLDYAHVWADIQAKQPYTRAAGVSYLDAVEQAGRTFGLLCWIQAKYVI